MSRLPIRQLAFLVMAVSFVLAAGFFALTFFFHSPFSLHLKILYCVWVILTAILAYFLAVKNRGTSAADSRQIMEGDRIRAQIEALNQELEERVGKQASELARLNIDLELEIARNKQAQESARVSEERFRYLADNIQEGLAIMEDGRVVYANRRSSEILGCSPQEHSERSWQTLLTRDGIKTSILESHPDALEYWIQREGGLPRCIREQTIFSHNAGKSRAYILTADITERVQAQQNMEQSVADRTRELTTVLEVSKNVASTLELESLLKLVLEQIEAIIPYTGAAIFTLQEDQLTVAAYLAPGLPLEGVPLQMQVDCSGMCQEVIQSCTVHFIDDVHGACPLAEAIQATAGLRDGFQMDNVHSWIGIPLVVKERVIGLMSLTHQTPAYYTQQHAHLSLAIANQVSVAIENARLYEQAQHLAAVEERQRLARELHDSVSQLLYAISLNSTAAIRSNRLSSSSHVDHLLVEIKENALAALQEMRLLIFELNPPMLEEAGLIAALEFSLQSVKTRTGLETHLTVDGVDRLPAALEGELYRIAMEALNNLVKYSRAKQVHVGLRADSGILCMEIWDNGIGFEPSAMKNSGGVGLRGMEQRARQIGGKLEVSSCPGYGTRVKVEVGLVPVLPACWTEVIEGGVKCPTLSVS